MPALPDQHDRVMRGKIVKVAGFGLSLLFPSMLIPRTANDPFAWLSVCYGLPDPRPAVFDGGKIPQVQPLEIQAEVHKMKMSIHNPGSDEAARQFEHLSPSTADSPHLVVGSHDKDPVLFRAQGFGPGSGGIAGEDSGGKNRCLHVYLR
jgi:hypothetical protein